jgi:hypothetical protein
MLLANVCSLLVFFVASSSSFSVFTDSHASLSHALIFFQLNSFKQTDVGM